MESSITYQTGTVKHEGNYRMRINNYIEGSRVNGPGFRFCIWVQGCERGCPGCFNQEACKMQGGIEMAVSEIFQIISRNKYDGISVSGGEPFYQRKDLELLLKTAKKQNLNTLVFTGFLYEELLKDCSSILRYCDYLIDGPYIRELPSHCKYAGSGNQRYLKLRDGLIESDLTFSTEDSSECEIIINSDGIVTTTGFFDIL